MGTSIHAPPQIPVSVLALPKTPETVASLPVAPVTVLSMPSAAEAALPLPAAGVTLLPAGFVPYSPPSAVAETSGEGLSTADVSGAYAAVSETASTGSSIADVIPIQYSEVSTSGDGDSLAAVTTAEVIEVNTLSEGASSADLAVLLTADTSAEGTSAVDTSVWVDALSSGEGNSTAGVTLVGVILPSTSGEGTSSADVRSFDPSGMVLGTQSSTRWGTAFAQVPGTWIADSTYPGSAVSGNDLVSQSDGTGLTVQASLYCHNNALTLDVDVWLQIKVNGTIVATSATPTQILRNARGVVTLQATGLTVPDNALIRIEGRASSGTRIAAEVNAATYVRIVQP